MAAKRVSPKQDVTARGDTRKSATRSDARNSEVAEARNVGVIEAARNYAPRGIAAVLAPVVRPAFRKRAPAAAQLLADWQTLAGPEFCTRAVPVKFAAGTLTLACTGPAAMELQLAAPTLISRLNLGVGNIMVERLRFVQQITGIPPAATTKPSGMALAPPENLPAGPLGDALAKLYKGIGTKS